MVEFDQCPALRKPHLQEVALFDMIAYKDAIRHHVCIGDKVLAPWQHDGRHGPGSVLDGVDRRDVQPEGNHVHFTMHKNSYLFITWKNVDISNLTRHERNFGQDFLVQSWFLKNSTKLLTDNSKG